MEQEQGVSDPVNYIVHKREGLVVWNYAFLPCLCGRDWLY